MNSPDSGIASHSSGCFFRKTDRVQSMGTPLAYLLLDLDRFAAVNREYGYSTCDKILRELGNRVRRFMRTMI